MTRPNWLRGLVVGFAVADVVAVALMLLVWGWSALLALLFLGPLALAGEAVVVLLLRMVVTNLAYARAAASDDEPGN